jgi:hypothetical protein
MSCNVVGMIIDREGLGSSSESFFRVLIRPGITKVHWLFETAFYLSDAYVCLLYGTD